MVCGLACSASLSPALGIAGVIAGTLRHTGTVLPMLAFCGCGTAFSLVAQGFEALGSTDLNLLLDVGFNSEVARDGALYWSKEPGNLGRLLKRADEMKEAERKELGERAKERIA